MNADRLSTRIDDQFSYRGNRADIWRVFDRLIATDTFLNLGYSPWYCPQLLGSSQRRLVRKLGHELVTRLPPREQYRVLDLGCGRGGPTIELVDRFGVDAIGLDLVPFNVTMARINATTRDVSPGLVIGDAQQLPFCTDRFDGAIAVDSMVYIPDKPTTFANLARTVKQDGIVVISDLVCRETVSRTRASALQAFAESWDMPRILTEAEYLDSLRSANWIIESQADITDHSIGRLRKWSWLYLGLETVVGPIIRRRLTARGLDHDTITEQIRWAHEALPALAHVIIIARNRSG